MRIEPPLSVPSAAKQKPAPTAVADPPLDPVARDRLPDEVVEGLGGEGDEGLADPDEVPAVEGVAGDALAVDVGAVSASRVLHEPPAVRGLDREVLPGDAPVRYVDGAAGVAARVDTFLTGKLDHLAPGGT